MRPGARQLIGHSAPIGVPGIWWTVCASVVAGQGIDGAPRVFLDLREAGETCSTHRVVRLMRENGLRVLYGYRTRRWSVGKPAVLILNPQQRQFTVTKPNTAWVTDITRMRRWQGWLCLCGIDEQRFPERIVPQQQRDAVTVWKVPEGKEPVAKHQDQHDRGRPPTERCASWRPCRWN